MVVIKLLGTGCHKTQALRDIVLDCVAELDIDAEWEEISDIDKIVGYNITVTPSLIINDKLVFQGEADYETIHVLLSRYSLLSKNNLIKV